MGFISDFFEALRGFFSGANAGTDVPGGHRLYVGNLSYRASEEELRGLFSRVGRVKTLHLIRDRLTRRLKGYAFLEMSTEDASKALSLNGTEFLGRKLVVSIAKTRKNEGPRRPSYQRWKKRRNGPRAYGPPNKDDSPVQRLE